MQKGGIHGHCDTLLRTEGFVWSLRPGASYGHQELSSTGLRDGLLRVYRSPSTVFGVSWGAGVLGGRTNTLPCRVRPRKLEKDVYTSSPLDPYKGVSLGLNYEWFNLVKVGLGPRTLIVGEWHEKRNDPTHNLKVFRTLVVVSLDTYRVRGATASGPSGDKLQSELS